MEKEIGIEHANEIFKNVSSEVWKNIQNSFKHLRWSVNYGSHFTSISTILVGKEFTIVLTMLKNELIKVVISHEGGERSVNNFSIYTDKQNEDHIEKVSHQILRWIKQEVRRF